MATMATITDATRATFHERGFVVVPDALGAAHLARGRRVVAAMLAEEPYAWPRFARASPTPSPGSGAEVTR
jgi:hypothetical protein